VARAQATWSARPIPMLDIEDRLHLLSVILGLVLRRRGVRGLLDPSTIFKAGRPDELTPALEDPCVGAPQVRSLLIPRLGGGEELHRGPAFTPSGLRPAQSQLLCGAPFSDISARSRGPLCLPRGPTARQADPEEAGPPDPTQPGQQVKRLRLARSLNQEDLVKMGVPPIRAVRQLRRRHRPGDLMIDPPPLPTLAESLFRPLHRIELCPQIVTDAVPRSQRHHDRLQTGLPRPREQVVQLATPGFADPLATAGAVPDTPACLKTCEARTNRTSFIGREVDVDPLGLRHDSPLAKTNPFIRQEAGGRPLQPERGGATVAGNLILRILVNRFRSLTKTGVHPLFFRLLQRGSRAARAA